MKVTQSTKHTFEFTDVQKNVPHPFTQGERKAVITYVCLIYQVYDEPQEELDGDTVWFDYTFKGRDCKAGGSIDKRQKRPGLVTFVRTLDTWNFLRELVSFHLDPTPITEAMLEIIDGHIEAAKDREQEQIKRLMQ